MAKRYKVVIAQSGKMDVMNKKRYIIENFKYRDYAQNFSAKIKKAAQGLDTLPTGYDIYMKPKDGSNCASCIAGWNGLKVICRRDVNIGYIERIDKEQNDVLRSVLV